MPKRTDLIERNRCARCEHIAGLHVDGRCVVCERLSPPGLCVGTPSPPTSTIKPDVPARS
jgi:hypothetical protein